MTTFTLAHRPLTRLLSGLLFCLFLFGQTERATAQGQSFPCVLKCRDTTICFNLPDSMVQLLPPAYAPAGPVIGNGPDCQFDSIWSNAPGVYPVGTTVVTWYVWAPPGRLDSCTMNVVRNPPSSYTISFTTSPPIVGGVINICNGQSITFNDILYVDRENMEIKLKVSGREVTAAGQQAIDALKTNNSFKQIGVSLRDERPSIETLGRA
ncbi:MAG TPA: hypothetical protein PLI08_11675, partial [Bacteroidia bacterium]|nr:hypothetical protein [Bacteroidia bacterium]